MDDIQIELTCRLSTCRSKTTWRHLRHGTNTMRDGRVFKVTELEGPKGHVVQYSAQVGHPDSMAAYERFAAALRENKLRDGTARVSCRSYPHPGKAKYEVFVWEPAAPAPYVPPDLVIMDLFGGDK